MSFDISKHLKSVSKVKLPGGVVGKVSAVLIVVALTVGSLGVLSKNEWIMAGGIVAIIGISFPMLWRLINFADKNPQAAILEGAEFLVHEQIVMASKTDPRILVSVESQTIGKQVVLPPEVVETLAQPDSTARVLPPKES